MEINEEKVNVKLLRPEEGYFPSLSFAENLTFDEFEKSINPLISLLTYVINLAIV